MNTKQIGLALVLAFGQSISSAQAVYVYEFSGIVPDAATIIDLPVSAGETWTALVNVDETVADSSGLSSYGLYSGAVLDMSLSFSGGFSTSFAGSMTNQIRVFDNLSDSYTTYDGIGAYLEDSSNYLAIQVFNETNLSSLTSDALPLPGTVMASDLGGYGYTMLTYNGPSGGIAYADWTADNTEFEARASVPEPATLTLMGLGLIGLGFVSTKSSRKVKALCNQ